MHILFFLIGVAAYIGGYLLMVDARFVTHEMIALSVFIIGTLFVVGGGIIDAIEKLSKK